MQRRKIVYKSLQQPTGNLHAPRDEYTSLALAKVELGFTLYVYVMPAILPQLTVSFNFEKTYRMVAWRCHLEHNLPNSHPISRHLQLTMLQFDRHATMNSEPYAENSRILYGKSLDNKGMSFGGIGSGVVSWENNTFVLYAILSQTVGCNLKNQFSKFIQISHHLDWINNERERMERICGIVEYLKE